jgi:ATP-dependent Clp protease ATP-binding subunit ClpB
VIQRALQNPLAQLILEGKVMDGDTVSVGAGPDGLAIRPIHRGPAPIHDAASIDSAAAA